MSQGQFTSKYRILDLLSDGDITSYNARDRNGNPLMAHFLKPYIEEHQDIFSRLWFLFNDKDKSIIEITEHNGSPVVITTPIPNFRSLADWLEEKENAPSQRAGSGPAHDLRPRKVDLTITQVLPAQSGIPPQSDDSEQTIFVDPSLSEKQDGPSADQALSTTTSDNSKTKLLWRTSTLDANTGTDAAHDTTLNKDHASGKAPPTSQNAHSRTVDSDGAPKEEDLSPFDSSFTKLFKRPGLEDLPTSEPNPDSAPQPVQRKNLQRSTPSRPNFEALNPPIASAQPLPQSPDKPLPQEQDHPPSNTPSSSPLQTPQAFPQQLAQTALPPTQYEQTPPPPTPQYQQTQAPYRQPPATLTQDPASPPEGHPQFPHSQEQSLYPYGRHPPQTPHRQPQAPYNQDPASYPYDRHPPQTPQRQPQAPYNQDPASYPYGQYPPQNPHPQPQAPHNQNPASYPYGQYPPQAPHRQPQGQYGQAPTPSPNNPSSEHWSGNTAETGYPNPGDSRQLPYGQSLYGSVESLPQTPSERAAPSSMSQPEKSFTQLFLKPESIGKSTPLPSPAAAPHLSGDSYSTSGSQQQEASFQGYDQTSAGLSSTSSPNASSRSSKRDFSNEPSQSPASAPPTYRMNLESVSQPCRKDRHGYQDKAPNDSPGAPFGGGQPASLPSDDGPSPYTRLISRKGGGFDAAVPSSPPPSFSSLTDNKARPKQSNTAIWMGLIGVLLAAILIVVIMLAAIKSSESSQESSNDTTGDAKGPGRNYRAVSRADPSRPAALLVAHVARLHSAPRALQAGRLGSLTWRGNFDQDPKSSLTIEKVEAGRIVSNYQLGLGSRRTSSNSGTGKSEGT